MKTNCETCGSSDAKHIYEDGHSHCFSCNETLFPNEDKVKNDKYNSIDSIAGYRAYPIDDRSISLPVVNHYGIRMEVNEVGEAIAHYYPYTKNGTTVAYKRRFLPKSFSIVGDFNDVELFGQSSCTGSKTLVITEGELDCLSVAEAFLRIHRRIYPVVSIPSASANGNILKQRDWINSFQKIVLMLDNDEAGEKAKQYLAKLIKPGKCFIATLPEKDPSDTLIKHGPSAITRAVYDAREWSPAGIVSGEDIWEAFRNRQDTQSIPYPYALQGLNEKLEGMRLGEIALFTSGTGSGKSTVIKEIIIDLLDKTDERIGLVSLEESIGDTAEKFISMSLQRMLNAPPPPTTDELRKGYESIFGGNRLVLLDHQGSVSDSGLMDKIEYMALAGCKYIVLDHITIAVSEGSDGLSGNEAIDKTMSDLLKIVKRHNIWLGLISHLRKTAGGKPFEEGNLAGLDDIKGSGSIKQISFDIIAFARNLVAEDETERNTIYFRVLKSRFTGRTGDAGKAIYNTKTTRLSRDLTIDIEGF